MSDEIGRIVTAQRRRNAEAVRRREARLQEAKREAARLASDFVAEDPSTRLVILFGSVATGRVRSDGFDIDLAVDADRFLRLVELAEDSEFRVDVVDLRTVSRGFRERVLSEGIALHGTKS